MLFVPSTGELALRELLAQLRALHEVAAEGDIREASGRRTHEGGVIPLNEEQVGAGAGAIVRRETKIEKQNAERM
jgi:hypothetical protein